MDLLGSIMSQMDKTPRSCVDDKQKKLMKEQQKAFEVAKDKEKEKLQVFRKNIEERIFKFMQDNKAMKKIFEPMDHVSRSIVRDVADVAGLTSFAFGTEEEDRHIMVFKKEYEISERELNAYRHGVEWDAESDKQTLKLEEQQKQEDLEEVKQRKKESRIQGPTSFVEKVERLVGKETGKDSARILVANEQFGYVKSELKKDKRTIEQTLDDIRAKKRARQEKEDEHKQDSVL